MNEQSIQVLVAEKVRKTGMSIGEALKQVIYFDLPEFYEAVNDSQSTEHKTLIGCVARIDELN